MRNQHELGAGALTPAVLHILLALTHGPLHAYAVMKEASRTAGPRLHMGPSTVYGCLARLEAGELVDRTAPASGVQDVRRASPYRLTEEGRRILGEEAQRLAGTLALLRARGLV